MGYTVEWLTQKEYPETLDFLNMVFSMASKPHQFKAMLPKMWEYDGKYNTKHLAVKVDGKIKALLGVYPINVRVAGEDLLFCTVGNVATHPDETGKGYMSILLNEAMKKLDEIGADVSRLGGKRARYNRYGYETAGIQYQFTLKNHNIASFYGNNFKSDITFKRIEKSDEKSLLFAKSLFETSEMWVDRINTAIFYDTLTAWKNTPYLALCGENPVGYLTVAENKTTVTEIRGLSTDISLEILSAWLQKNGLSAISLTLEPWQTEFIGKLQSACESWNGSTPSLFCIRHWDKAVYTFMKLKNQHTPLQDGELLLGIENYGTLHISVKNGEISVIKEDTPTGFVLNRLQATRFIFGMMPPYTVCETPKEILSTASLWFPLPLSWNTLDRV